MNKNEYFEGDFRRKPSQDLSGAKRISKVVDFIDKVQRDRKKREENRLEIKKATSIQAAFRGNVVRKKIKEQLKSELNSKVSELKRKANKDLEVDLNDISYLMGRIQLIYPKNSHWTCYVIIYRSDYDNIVFVSRMVLNYKEQIILAMVEDTDWLWRIVRLFYVFIDLMKPLAIDFDEMSPTLLHAIREYLDPGVIVEDQSSKINIFLLIMERLLSYGLLKILLMATSRKRSLPPQIFHELFSHAKELFKIIFGVISCTKNLDFGEKTLTLIAEEIVCRENSDENKKLLSSCFKEIQNFPLELLIKVMLNSENQKWYSTHTLYNVLSYFDDEVISMPVKEQKMYFLLLSKLTVNIPMIRKPLQSLEETADSFPDNCEQFLIVTDCFNMINSFERTGKWLSLLVGFIKRKDFDGIFWFCNNLYHLWLFDCAPVYKHNLIRKTAFPPHILKPLWKLINNEKRILSHSSQLYSATVLDMLSNGVPITSIEADRIIPALTMFSFLFRNHMALLSDDVWDEKELFPGGEDQIMFTLDEVSSICEVLKEVAIGIVSLAFPSVSMHGVEKRIDELAPTGNLDFNTFAWRTLQEQLVSLLWLLHDRDCRRQFMKHPSSWLSDAFQDFNQPFSQLKKIGNITPFSSPPGNFSRDFAIYEKRYLTIIRTLPFSIKFLKRFTLYQSYIADSKMEVQNPLLHFLELPFVLLKIRRDYLYEDALEQLSSESDIRKQIRVNFINPLGIDEMGIDGGGLFREFLIEFLKTAFDPNRGFFIMNRDNEFYPNPNISAICQDYKTHYYFIGRMLGKALFENILVEVPLADFFLNEIVGHSNELYINGLTTLDPDLYKNLISLTCYKGDINELGLDFTLTLDDFGESRVTEMKQHGTDISVNEENLIEYIHLVSQYKTHTQIENQTSSFFEGLDSIISLDWLRMFTAREVQLIISGDKSPIDVDDLRAHTVYSGGYSTQHPTIVMFWKVVSSFTNSQRSLLLRFVTSCSRPPLLGFKELFPPFCIQLAEVSDNRLPSSSTCMNILKLPEFTNEDTLKEKLLYAIQSRCGFELI